MILSLLFQPHCFIMLLFQCCNRVSVDSSVISELSSYTAGQDFEPHLPRLFLFLLFNPGEAEYLLLVIKSCPMNSLKVAGEAKYLLQVIKICPLNSLKVAGQGQKQCSPCLLYTSDAADDC